MTPAWVALPVYCVLAFALVLLVIAIVRLNRIGDTVRSLSIPLAVHLPRCASCGRDGMDVSNSAEFEGPVPAPVGKNAALRVRFRVCNGCIASAQ